MEQRPSYAVALVVGVRLESRVSPEHVDIVAVGKALLILTLGSQSSSSNRLGHGAAPNAGRALPAISEFPKWRKYLISLSFRGQSSVRPVQVGGFDVNIVIHRSTAVRGRGGPARHDAWPPSLGAILAHTDGPCGS